jgi:cell division transport system permease protein
MLDSISIFRIIKTGFTNFWRNLWLSAAATMVVTTTLVIFAVLFLLFAVTSYSIKSIQNTVDISVYFKSGLVEDQILSVKKDLEADPKIKQVSYTSSAAAFDQFKTVHQNDPLITQSLNELTENPLPAAINIQAKNLDDYPQIATQLNDSKYKDLIAKVNFEDNRQIIDRLGKILKFIITFGIGLIAVFSLIAVFVIFNTITLTIYNRREEVEIMRLVGATNWYIRGPFLTEAMLYSIFSTVLAGLLCVPVFTKVLPKITMFVNPQVTLFNQNILNFWFLLAILFVLALILAVVSTFLATRKYLKI